MTTESNFATLIQLTHRLFRFLDERRYADILGLMRPDAVWHRQGKRLGGHGEILAALEERSPTQRIRHVVSNCIFDSANEESATLNAYMIAYRFDDGTQRQPPLAIDGPLSMSLLTARFGRDTGGRWLIVELTSVPEFEFRTPQSQPKR